MRRARIVLAGVLISGVFAVPALPATGKTKPPLVRVTCGATVQQSIRLANNLVDCATDGINVGGADITIDLNGHRIDSNGTPGTQGIDIAGFSGVTVKNGVLTDWPTAVYAEHVNRLRLSKLFVQEGTSGLRGDDINQSSITGNVITGTTTGAISLDLSSDNNVISGNTIDRAGSGISTGAMSDGNEITKNTVVGSASGISVGISTGGTIAKNRVIGSYNPTPTAAIGMFANMTDGTVEKNTITGSESAGLILGDSGVRMRVTENIITGSGGLGVSVDDNVDTILQGNVVNANREDGIRVFDGTGTRLTGNATSENGGHGINSDTNSVTLKNNIANLNGFLNGTDDNAGYGFVTPVATPGSGNTARQNDNSAQCTGVDCAPGPALGFTPTFVTCGAAVSGDAHIVHDLSDCPGDGVVVTADDTKIDLGGHRIDSNGANGSYGVNDLAGFDRLTVRNGVLTDWSRGTGFIDVVDSRVFDLTVLRTNIGILLTGNSPDNTVADNVVTGTVNAAIHLESGSGRTLLKRNFSSDNGSGISAHGNVGHNTLAGNTVISNGFGISLSGQGNVVSGNTAFASSLDGVITSNGDDSVSGNRLIGNGRAGLYLNESQGPTVEKNVLTGNDQDGLVLDDVENAKVTQNRIGSNDDSGIRVSIGSGSAITANRLTENGLHGLTSDTNALKIRDNNASSNGYIGGTPNSVGLGINIPLGGVTSGNTAKGNDDPAECEADDVDCHVDP